MTREFPAVRILSLWLLFFAHRRLDPSPPLLLGQCSRSLMMRSLSIQVILVRSNLIILLSSVLVNNFISTCEFYLGFFSRSFPHPIQYRGE